jgi:hypothetical protein
MDRDTYYEIRVEGVLNDSWSDWFEGLEVCSDSDGGTTMKGPLVDQAALFSVLTRINNLNLTLVSVARSSPRATYSRNKAATP